MIDQTIANLANLVLKYDELEAKVNGHDQEIADINNKSSYVGKIIMSTALDTLEKVRAIYGENTTWVKIEGRVLLGASSSYPVKTTAELASHTHTFTGTSSNHTHTFTGKAVITENDNATHQHPMPYSTQTWFKTNATNGILQHMVLQDIQQMDIQLDLKMHHMHIGLLQLALILLHL